MPKWRAEIEQVTILTIEFEQDAMPTDDDIFDAMSDCENHIDTWDSEEKILSCEEVTDELV